MLTWLIVTVLILLALLAVPLRIAVVMQPDAEPRYELRISWLFGLIRAPITPDAAKPDESERQRLQRERQSGTTAWTFRQTMAFVRGAGGVARFHALMRDLIASLHPQVIAMHVEVGFDDPADTGRAWALLGPLAAWVAQRYGAVTFQPGFFEPGLVIAGRAHLTVVPLYTLAVLLRYAASPRTLRGLYAAHRTSLR